MQSEGGAAGAVHGALQSGALTTTFTASQGLMLMLPNMFKIAGELTADGVPRRGARAGDAGAVDLRRPFRRDGGAHDRALPCCPPRSVQEAHDAALIAQAATLEARVPFLHFFDGFRTSHELNTLELLSDAQIRAMIDDDLVRAHRARALNPEHPFDPRHRAQPRHLLPGARDGEPVLRAGAGDRAGGRWTGSPRSPAGSTSCSSTTAPPTPSA